MVTKIYECTCDNCGTCLNHYIGYRPDVTDFKRDEIKYKYINGELNIFCNECFKELKKKK